MFKYNIMLSNIKTLKTVLVIELIYVNTSNNLTAY